MGTFYFNMLEGCGPNPQRIGSLPISQKILLAHKVWFSNCSILMAFLVPEFFLFPIPCNLKLSVLVTWISILFLPLLTKNIKLQRGSSHFDRMYSWTRDMCYTDTFRTVIILTDQYVLYPLIWGSRICLIPMNAFWWFCSSLFLLIQNCGWVSGLRYTTTHCMRSKVCLWWKHDFLGRGVEPQRMLGFEA